MCSVGNVYELCSELVMHMLIQYETDNLSSAPKLECRKDGLSKYKCSWYVI